MSNPPSVPSYAQGTQIGPDGARVSMEEAEEAASFDGEPNSPRIDPETQIAPDGSREPIPEGGAEDVEDAPDAESLEDTQIAEDGSRQAIEEEPDDDGDGGEAAGASEDEDDGLDEEQRSLKELRTRAQELDISGRSSMNKDELAEAVAEAEGEQDN